MSNREKSSFSPGMSGLARVTWMMLGPMMTALGCAGVFQSSGFGPYDVLAIIGAALTIAARWIDIAWLDGETADGGPANVVHWYRFSVGTLLIAGALLVVAHWFGG